MANVWTDSLVAQLTELWKINSASAIAGIMSMDGVVFTRSAIMGKVRRLGLFTDEKASVIGVKRAAPRTSISVVALRQVRPAFQQIAIVRSSTDEGALHKSIIELENGECRYGYGDSPSFTFCAQPVIGLSSYCSGHHRRCVNEPPKMKPRAYQERTHVRPFVFGSGRDV